MTATAKTTTNRSRARRRFDQRKYGRLLAQTVPVVIYSETECRRVEAEISKLLRKGDGLTPENERVPATLWRTYGFLACAALPQGRHLLSRIERRGLSSDLRGIHTWFNHSRGH
jgi:hypothetical protein